MPKQRQIGFEIRTINNLIKRYFEQHKPEGLEESTGVHGWAIGYFYENRNKDVFQRDFELHFSIRRSTATNMLKLMEKNGLIRRESVDYDARLKKIVLTEKAIAIHKSAIENIFFLEDTLKRGISEEELKLFYKVLDKVKDNLEVEE